MAMRESWKSKVSELNSGIDKAHGNIEALKKMDKHLMRKKEIYSNPNTKVEVTVKTKRSSKENQDWSTLLSDSNDDQKVKKKSVPLNKKRFVQNTKASTAKSKTVTSRDQIDSKPIKSAKNEYENQQIFPNRTLQIFLKEMRLALKNKESREQVSNILDDLEHIATNLGFEDQKSALTHR